MAARLCHSPFIPAEELADFMAGVEAGAVASFTGIARRCSQGGAPVTGLFLDHHERLTGQSLEAIEADARTRFALADVLIVHRCGRIAPGEPIVLAAASARHRKAALEAVDYMMDRLKSEAVFWKREDRADGSEWIEPTDEDRRALARWDES
jgi:molybdopterin synthase catalytic subunit